MIQDAASFLAYWRNARSRTVRVLAALEPGDLEWAPMPGLFTFGDLFRHLAGLERFMFAENAQSRPSIHPGHGAELGSGLDGVRAYLDRCHGEALAIFGRLTDADLLAPCQNPAGAEMATPPDVPSTGGHSRSFVAESEPRKWLRAMSEHEAHHRGQLYLMASQRHRVVAPLFGLTEEELAARSRASSTSP